MVTGKERIQKAFANDGPADRVPFTLGLENVDLVSLSGLDYWSYQQQGRTMLGDLVHWADELEFDVFHYAAGIPEAHPSENAEIRTEESQQGDIRITKTMVSTSQGEIWQLRRCLRWSPELTTAKFIKDIKRDWPVFKDYFGDNWRVDEERFYQEYAYVGDRGVVGTVVHTPVDFWQEYRQGGAEQMIFDFLDEKKIMQAFCEYYRHISLAYLAALGALHPKPDFVLLHGSNCSASLISPDIFQHYALPFIRDASALLAEMGIPSVLHICGKCREWLDGIADTEVKVMDALEHAPAGNIDLGEVKKRYGQKFCLKGNVSALTMACGSQEEVRTEVKECLAAAGQGGGFILDVGDSIGPHVQLENLQEFVAAAWDYGQ